MGRINYIQSSFTSGEITPRLVGRLDLTQYKSALATCENFMISPYGCIYRRPGTKYIGASMSNSNVSKLIRFEYSTTDTYNLEFGDSKIRFFKNQGQVLQSRQFTNGSFPTNINGWTARNAGTGAISWDAVNLTLNLTGGGAGNEARAYQMIQRLGISSYTVTLDVIGASVVYRVGTTVGGSTIATGTLTVGTGRTFTFTSSVNQDLYFEFESSGAADIDNIVLSNPIYEIDSPYPIAVVDDLRFSSSYDTLIITHGSYAPKKLQRFSDDSWSISDLVFDEPAYMDANDTDITLTPAATTGSVNVTASANLFAPTDIGRAIRYKAGPDKSNTTTYTGTGAQTYFDITFYPQTSDNVVVSFIENTGLRTAKTFTAGAPGAGQFTITGSQVRTGDTATTSQRVEIKPANVGSGEWGYMLITAYTSPTLVTASVQRTLAGTNASTEWRLGAWSQTTGYPVVSVFHEQRLFFANTSAEPQKFWGSQIGNYTNFQPDNILYKGAVDSDTSVAFELASGNQATNIVWLASKGSLLLGTTNAVFTAKGSSGGISASNITVRKEADIPCAFKEVTETANEVLFIDKDRNKVFSTYYLFDIDGYSVEDITLLSEHIGKRSKIKQIAYQPTSNALWVVLEDGTMATSTYIRSQRLNGWARHNVAGGSVKYVSVISGTEHYEPWLIVQRDVSGTKNYVEMIQKEFVFSTKQLANFLDCSAVYSGVATSTISGLSFLEGKTVSVLVNGATHRDLVVSSGAITLDYPATYVVVGLHYDSVFETLPLEGGSQFGTSQGSISRITEVVLNFFETIGGYLGREEADAELILFRSPSDPMDASPSMFTGKKDVKFSYGQALDYKVYYKQAQPLPATILSYVAKSIVADT